MDVKLNIWQARDLSLFGRTLLVKTLGLSKLVYATFMLFVPEMVISREQEKIINVLWKNKNDKIKRSVIYQPLSSTVVKSLRLSWLGRFLNRTNESWQAIPNDSFKRVGGLPFLLKCNYDSKLLDKPPPVFYSEMLDYFKELRSGYRDVYKSEFILWNNKEITIESKSIFWAHLFEKGICFVQDLSDENGKFLSLEDLQVKYNFQLNFFNISNLLLRFQAA